MARANLRLVVADPKPARPVRTETELRRLHRKIAATLCTLSRLQEAELAVRKRYADENNMLVPRFETVRAFLSEARG